MATVCLQIKKGRETKKKYFLAKEIIIGRSPQCDLVLPNDFIGRKHAKIYYHKGKPVYEMLSQVNPSIINGQKITKVWFLKQEDIIAFPGTDYEILFSIKEDKVALKVMALPSWLVRNKRQWLILASALALIIGLAIVYLNQASKKINFHKRLITGELWERKREQAIFYVFNLEDDFFLKAFEDTPSTSLVFQRFKAEKKGQGFEETSDVQVKVEIDSKYRLTKITKNSVIEDLAKKYIFTYKPAIEIKEYRGQKFYGLTKKIEQLGQRIERNYLMVPDTLFVNSTIIKKAGGNSFEVLKKSATGNVLQKEINKSIPNGEVYARYNSVGTEIYSIRKIRNKKKLVAKMIFKGYGQEVEYTLDIEYDVHDSPRKIIWQEKNQKAEWTFDYQYNEAGLWTERIDKLNGVILQKVKVRIG